MRNRRHALGQNFLHHKPTIEKILAEVEVLLKSAPQTKFILEIGPGKLAITKPLVPLCEEKKLPLVLVERDLKLEELIRRDLSETAKIEIHFMDAASADFEALLKSLHQRSGGKTTVVSNLPYSASTQIIAKLCHQSHLLDGCILMVQKEVADRLAAPAGSKDRGSLSLLLQSYFDIEILFDVKPGCFTPPPKVMSTVFKLIPLAKNKLVGIDDHLKFEHFCKMIFSKRRKMIRGIIPPNVHHLFPELGISGTERPEELSLEIMIALYIEGARAANSFGTESQVDE